MWVSFASMPTGLLSLAINASISSWTAMGILVFMEENVSNLIVQCTNPTRCVVMMFLDATDLRKRKWNLATDDSVSGVWHRKRQRSPINGTFLYVSFGGSPPCRFSCPWVTLQIRITYGDGVDGLFRKQHGVHNSDCMYLPTGLDVVCVGVSVSLPPSCAVSVARS